MRYSELFSKTSKTVSGDADSKNAKFLMRGGFTDQLMAGVYTYLPLGLRVLNKIKKIIREEINALGATEILMPALHPKDNWEVTGRWNDPGPEVMFRVKGREDKEFGLGWTHEEIVTPLAKKFIHSYKDLPFSVYQIQDKFRNEPRAKSGLLRTREFSMKDLYSFHTTEEDLAEFYEKAKKAYSKIFTRCGLDALIVEASGGAFSRVSHEFQVLTESGEDIIFYCDKCKYAQNREISTLHAGDKCAKCKGGVIKESKAIEVGNIFELKTRFSKAFNLTYKDKDGKENLVLMGCYGIGPSRVMGTIAEIYNDERGLVWPEEVAPFKVHIVEIRNPKSEIRNKTQKIAEKLYEDLNKKGVEVLYDDRENVSAGEKFADADLIGCPWRVVVSEKSLAAGGVEAKKRASEKIEVIKPLDILKFI